MSNEQWPSPYEPSQPALPRVEDLPVASEGYDRQKVREAFDAFYRHAAQLDTALRTLEAVEAFQRSASDLRADLRAIRAAGFSAQTWQRSYGTEGRLSRPLLPESFVRVTAEVVFLIAVAVALGVSGWGALRVIGVMAVALAIVWAAEWLASREGAGRRAQPVRRPAAPPAPAEEEPAGVAEEVGAPSGWAAFAEPDEERADALTMVEPLPGGPGDKEGAAATVEPEEAEWAPVAEVEAEAPGSAPGEADVPAEPEPAEAESEPEPAVGEVESKPTPDQPEPAVEPEPESEEPRQRLFVRGPTAADVEDEPAAAGEPEPEPLLARGPDPWEQGFELPVDAEAEPASALVDDKAAEPEAAEEKPPAAVVEQPGEPEELPQEPGELPEEPDELPEEPEALPEEPEELPIEVLSEQVASALERSRVRRRQLRRARRR